MVSPIEIPEDCSKYYAVLRFKRFVDGKYEVIANFGSGDKPDKFLLIHVREPMVMCMYFEPNLLLTVVFPKMIGASAAMNAILQAQADGILPKPVVT